jgi:ABC-type amino acid transport substrate-binding protein
MKNTTTLILSIILSTACAYGFLLSKIERSNQQPNSVESTLESTYDRVMAAQEIKCGYGISPPNLTKNANTGQMAGADYDIWQEIGKELGLKITWAQEAGWGNFIQDLKQNRFDVFCSQLWPDPPRTKFLTLSQPVIYSPLFAYVRVGDTRFNGNEDAINNGNVTIPAVDGDVGMDMAKSRFPAANILTLPQTATLSDMLLSVITKKADILFLNQAMFDDFNKANPNKLVRVPNLPPSFLFASRYGFKQGDVALRDMINVALQKITDDGRLEKIAKKYDSSAIVAKKGY